MQKLKITIIGNSVTLRVRPPKRSPKNLTYGEILESRLQEKIRDRLVLVNNMGKGAATIKRCLHNIDHYVSSSPDYFIINIGVVDACTREVPFWVYNIATSKHYNTLTKVCRFLYRGVIMKFRPYLVNARFKRSWTSKKTFRTLYRELLVTLLKDTNAQIITLPINIADDRIERELPGSRKNHYKFNDIIEQLSCEYGLRYIDLTSLNATEHYPDGVHYSVAGHQCVAEKISYAIFGENHVKPSKLN